MQDDLRTEPDREPTDRAVPDGDAAAGQDGPQVGILADVAEGLGPPDIVGCASRPAHERFVPVENRIGPPRTIRVVLYGRNRDGKQHDQNYEPVSHVQIRILQWGASFPGPPFSEFPRVLSEPWRPPAIL